MKWLGLFLENYIKWKILILIVGCAILVIGFFEMMKISYRWELRIGYSREGELVVCGRLYVEFL